MKDTMDGSAGVLTAGGLSFVRGRRRRVILNNINLALRPGEILTLLGPNGAGKTTLLKIMAGELKPDTGTVHLDGRVLSDFSPGELARRRAVLPQESALGFDFPVIDVVLLGRMPYLQQRENRRDLRLARLAMRLAGVSHLSERTYTKLSGGERQRVHLARVLCQILDTRKSGGVLFLDEPTASLDLRHQHDILRSVRRFARSGMSVLVILHDLNLAAVYADRIALLDRGALHAVGTPDEVLRRDLIRDVYGMDCRVIPHPVGGFPLVIPLP